MTRAFYYGLIIASGVANAPCSSQEVWSQAHPSEVAEEWLTKTVCAELKWSPNPVGPLILCVRPG